MPQRNNLELRQLGSGGLRVSALGLGCMSLSGVYGESNDEEAVSLIRYALDQGVTLLDTADMYGWGQNEELVVIPPIELVHPEVCLEADRRALSQTFCFR